MKRVVLVYDSDCPNVELARENLRCAFEAVSAPPRWEELDRAGVETPEPWRGYGSPTVLVDGADVAGGTPGTDAPTCRLYRDGRTFVGAPPVAILAAALLADGAAGLRRGVAWKQTLATLPGIGAALLPKVACPACWPAYAGVLSALGLGFLLQTRYLLPLTVAFLAVALAAIGFRARSRRGYGPLALATLGAMVLLVGKFLFDSDPVLGLGVATLVAASAWNAWPRRRDSDDSFGCTACAPAVHAVPEPQGASTPGENP